jgi:hypothetical protein
MRLGDRFSHLAHRIDVHRDRFAYGHRRSSIPDFLLMLASWPTGINRAKQAYLLGRRISR